MPLAVVNIRTVISFMQFPKKKDIKSEKKVKKEKGRKKKKNEGAVHLVLVFGIGMELPAGGPPQAKLPAGIAAELRSLVKRKKPTGVLGFILHCVERGIEPSTTG